MRIAGRNLRFVFNRAERDAVEADHSHRGSGSRLRSSGLARAAGWLVGVATFLVLLLPDRFTWFPPVPSPLTLTITFPTGVGGEAEPLFATGSTGNGDILAVRYVDEGTAVLVYDVWGVGGPTSAPFALQPGVRRRLSVTMPTFAHISHTRSHEQRPLRVTLDNHEIFDAEVYFHRRQPAEIFFGTNPLGGTVAGPRFRGRLEMPGGRDLRGGPEAMFGWRARLHWLIRERWGRLVAVLLAGVAAGLVVTTRLHAWRVSPRPSNVAAKPAVHLVSPHRWFLATAAVCIIAFSALISGGTFRLIYPESFGSFYDYQAASLLAGRLDVPEAAIQREAFVVNGRYYGYFGLTPALLRTPLSPFETLRGELSQSYMVAYYAAALTAAYLLLCYAVCVMSGGRSHPSRGAVVLFTLTVGAGSTLFFLGSRAYIYHEAILCGATLALWSAYAALRYLGAPDSKWWLVALLCGLLAVHARPTTGLFSLTLLATAALVALVRRRPNASTLGTGWSWRFGRRHVLIGALCVVAFASFNAVSYLKFGTFDGSPFRYSVQYSTERLARFGGRNFHFANLRHNLDVYLVRPAFTLERHFPYFYLGARDSPRPFPEARIDMVEPTLGVPYAMPALFVLGSLGAVLAASQARIARETLLVVWVAALPMLVGMLTIVVLSHRYTADFCPLLITSAAFGLAAVDTLAGRTRAVLLGLAGILAATSLCTTAALSLHYRGEMVWGIPDESRQQYQVLRRRVDAFFGVKP